MEFVKCEDCQCWNKGHWLIKNNEDANKNFGVCQRHAPVMNPGALRFFAKYLINKSNNKLEDMNEVYNASPARAVPTMRADDGCWEGVRK